MKNVLYAKKIKKIYGSRGNVYTALQEIDLQIKEGEFVGIMGPSGAGKTTLLNILSTIDQPSSGEIMIDGSDVVKMSEDELSSFRRERLGFIFQDYNLLDTLTVKENIALPLALAKVSARDIEQRVEEIANKFGIKEILSKFPYQISGGQKQRTAASRAIISKPSLIFADEPTGALDSKSATELLQSLSGLNEQERATIMMVTHDAFAASYCKRVLFIKDGAIFTELAKGNQSRKEFFEKILNVLSVLGGGKNDII
ncbi:ABC transporter ATP-binding protein [Aneurinibacillus aneurinilyticus]|uniref:ABC transporter, ATP-binding protein n=1 Tax=Aneurinibacillus aneurinilyticus ATCC 12856 TaxID=649747 RepID=U1XYU3_ANEAE|nr:ABC transporter ATP-binding protein [Aneurinibacillus aneurinilyticus]ERI05167.1 ABC transporter, ATP-binding protein [Aneurinibacillus aneurinilyticus ATCC 12856]MED0672453.1 ABC transporter ATP-binding protein [Aneurinibacillus aneurinilyticus]MED0708170.1 ABC transporter ATP-binding protein [Aneurinibacillus aneurinilyticus]MED0721477.1 ABC transporter ATP-binding protein [Aneurinibacillus aneurinilyticus]MED0734055.1 ABC transporter ATP-binding protein [Aneurinibacillus aneurinilyticus]